MALSDQYREDIRNFLISRGLAFKPLLDEMSDHVACDLEELMDSGLSYEEAWKKTIAELPDDHFIQIQKETMETINTRFTLSRVLTYAGMAALFCATIFKIMHLRGADVLLISTFVILAASLLTGSVSGIYINRDKKGAVRVISVVLAVVLLEVGYALRLLHLPGADQVIIASVAALLVALTINTLYVYNNASGDGNLFTFLHDKYSPGIERFLLIILPFAIFPITGVILIFCAALHFIALTWTTMEKEMDKKDAGTLVLTLLSFTCVMLPMLGHVLDFNIRLALITLFSFTGAALCFRMEPSRNASSYLICVAPVMFVLIAMMKIGWMQSFAGNWALNIIVIISMIASIFFSEKGSMSRTFMILSLAGYYLEIITTRY